MVCTSVCILIDCNADFFQPLYCGSGAMDSSGGRQQTRRVARLRRSVPKRACTWKDPSKKNKSGTGKGKDKSGDMKVLSELTNVFNLLTVFINQPAEHVQSLKHAKVRLLSCGCPSDGVNGDGSTLKLEKTPKQLLI